MKKYGLLFLPLLILCVFALFRPDSVPTAAIMNTRTPCLLIDAGHGGADGGAVAADGTTESSLNLAVAQKLEALCTFFGVETIMTRSSEEIDYPTEADTIRAKKNADQKARVALINSVPDGVLISIHQNMYPSAGPSGAQVLYGATKGSQELGLLMQENLLLLSGDNRRTAEAVSKDIFLMRSARCPSVLVECGFLSNPHECSLLKTEDYQRKLAVILAASFFQYSSDTEDYYGEI